MVKNIFKKNQNSSKNSSKNLSKNSKIRQTKSSKKFVEKIRQKNIVKKISQKIRQKIRNKSYDNFLSLSFVCGRVKLLRTEIGLAKMVLIFLTYFCYEFLRQPSPYIPPGLAPFVGWNDIIRHHKTLVKKTKQKKL